jgi:hypothetical protein
MQLLKSEQESLAFVQQIGLKRAHRILDLISHRKSRRLANANRESNGFIMDDLHLKVSAWERDLDFKIKMGLTLSNDDTPAKAHQRILDRRLKMKLELEAKRALKGAA